MPIELLGDGLVDVADGLANALAKKAVLHAVAQLPGFVLAGARAARHDRVAARAASKSYNSFNGWIAARINNLAAVNLNDLG